MAAPAEHETPSAEVIGQVFAEQYYAVLHHKPEVVFQFYKDDSKLSRPEDGNAANSVLTTGVEAISAKIQSNGNLRAELTSVDAQESGNGGVIVLITGLMIKEDGESQSFTQTFFLAPQDLGYYVLNDIFRYLDNDQLRREVDNLANGVAALNTSDQAAVQHDDVVVDQPEVEEVHGGEVYDPSEDGESSVIEQEDPEPIAEVVDEVPPEPMAAVAVVVAETKTEVEPEKKSYASIVKVMRESGAPIRAPASLKPKPKMQHKQVSVARSTPPAPAPPVTLNEKAVSDSNVAEDGNNQEGEGEGFSIYVKNLPLNATPAMVEEAFKSFGPIKSGGIQVRNSKGFGFGFVEFEALDAVEKAIEAGSVVIDGYQAGIEEKKSTFSRANSRGRFPQGRGGFRNEGPRGRGGNYGRGRGYGRGEFGGRGDYGNRGSGRGYQNRNPDAYQNRNPDGYHRSEMGNGGSTRGNRGGLSAANGVENTQNVPSAAV